MDGLSWWCLDADRHHFNKYVWIDYVSGGEMFTHLYQRDHFSEEEVKIYIGEIVLALEHLHKVTLAI